MKITKNIHMFNVDEKDGNIYLIDGQVLVDTGTGDNFTEIKQQIIDLGYDPRMIKTIVNTHCHFDHIGGDRKFRNWLKASIVMHEDDVGFVEKGREEVLAHMFGHSPRILTVDEDLAHGDVIKTLNHDFKVIHTPGHTPGSICLFDANAKILISGDTLFSDGIGRTDLPSGDEAELRKSLEKLNKLETDYLLPGHGAPKFGGVRFIIKQMLNRMSKKYV